MYILDRETRDQCDNLCLNIILIFKRSTCISVSICKNISLKLKTFVITCMPLFSVAGNLMLSLLFDTVLFIKLPIYSKPDVTTCISRLKHENVPGASILQWRCCILLRETRKCASARIIPIKSHVCGTSQPTKTITTRIFFSNWLKSYSYFVFVILLWRIVLFYLILLANYIFRYK